MSDRRLSMGSIALVAVGSLALTACQAKDDLPGVSADEPTQSASETPVPPLRLVASVKKGASDVPVDREVSVQARGGTIASVDLSSADGELEGDLSADGSSWTATDRLEPGTSYTMTTTATKSDGTEVTRSARFSTRDLTLDEQTYPSVAPLADETVGVGMPVIVTFDLPVKDKAAFEQHMHVTSSPQQVGSWHWLSDHEVHWRPQTYWKPNTDVHVDVDVNSIDAGDGIYGQENREVDFHVGAAHIYRVDTKTDQMRVFSNGKLLPPSRSRPACSRRTPPAREPR